MIAELAGECSPFMLEYVRDSLRWRPRRRSRAGLMVMKGSTMKRFDSRP